MCWRRVLIGDVISVVVDSVLAEGCQAPRVIYAPFRQVDAHALISQKARESEGVPKQIPETPTILCALQSGSVRQRISFSRSCLFSLSLSNGILRVFGIAVIASRRQKEKDEGNLLAAAIASARE